MIKKPSERINEIQDKLKAENNDYSPGAYFIGALLTYLDEQAEKNAPKDNTVTVQTPNGKMPEVTLGNKIPLTGSF